MAIAIRERRKTEGQMPVYFRAPGETAARFQALADARRCTEADLLGMALDALETVPPGVPPLSALGHEFVAAAACAVAAA